MGTYYIDYHNASKLYDANEANPSAENGSFVDWDTANEFILAVQVLYDEVCNKATVGSQFKLQFSEDGGGWVDVGAATAIAWGTSTTLVDDAAGTQKITVAVPAGCSGSFEGADENEGDNTLPDSGTIAVGTAENWRELHWALNPTNANPGSTYTFQVVNITNSNTALLGAIASSLAIASSAIDVTATLDELSLTEYNPTVNKKVGFTAGLDELVLTEYNPTVTININVTAGFDEFILTEYNPTVKKDISFTAGLDELVLTEYNPTVDVGEVQNTASLNFFGAII